MSSHPTDRIAELIGQIVEDLFNLLVREPDALKWSAAQQANFAEPEEPDPDSDMRVISGSGALVEPQHRQ